MQNKNTVPFIKMNGLGNDFVIIDQRETTYDFDLHDIKHICDRHRGIGCDQLIFIKPPKNPNADIFMDMYNTDGSPLETCGNATRCVAHLMNMTPITIETKAGLFVCEKTADDLVKVEMVAPITNWADIPLAENHQWDQLPDIGHGLPQGYAVSVGNPHVVFVVDDVDNYDLEAIGPDIEHHPLFPNRINVELVQILDEKSVRMRVWERGVGITQACGSGATATGFVVVEKEFVKEPAVEVIMDGGSVEIAYEHQRLTMTGGVSYNFEGSYYKKAVAAQRKTA